MPYIAPEVVQEAKRMDLLTYLKHDYRGLPGQDVYKAGNRIENAVQLPNHSNTGLCV